ncbi:MULTISPECIES: tripartite tricarboxylate transporter TctB family protein [unclassified Vibrio]|uniref:tripartite tricarboxylate transporter TctB family protein n=1 Tax=unclassified Vibrio TaxID=2614977 RepID=UPI0013610C1A|nr:MULTISPECIES: tripartite tricarboxylate transporter TctB family protein [unclassified Vibrio]NAW57977.1 tripartite tricarboxylate transporter TctB family protein [Vibrio sp. V36_P2S2PM302]NAX24288.1 tripartite tricarboxylate transporter TctB family protein [Vibrio sp. V38_P2S17PM301]NAX32146.1 tripartite tricarboxylate transporter TctB family protein [Vibrio sp. V37_P2S8PM304]
MSDLPTNSLNQNKFSKEYLLYRDRVGALIFLLVCLCYGYQTYQIPLFPGDEYEPFTARTLPTILTFVGIGLSLLLLITGQPDKQSGAVLDFNWKLLIAFLVLMAAYGVGLTYLGFVIATGLFLMAGFYLLGERNKKILFGASFPFVIAFYLLLTQGLDIYLEPGLIFTAW